MCGTNVEVIRNRKEGAEAAAEGLGGGGRGVLRGGGADGGESKKKE